MNDDSLENMEKYTWGHGNAKVIIYEAHHLGEYGRRWHRYVLLSGGEVIFEGAEFSPSPLGGHDLGDRQVAELLSFLTLQPGDTDDEYFDGYTPRQLEWCQSAEAEELGYMAGDYEEYGTWYYDDSAG